MTWWIYLIKLNHQHSIFGTITVLIFGM